MTDAPALPIPVWWGGVNTLPEVIDPCLHQPVPPSEKDCCIDRLLYPFNEALSVWIIEHGKGKIPASVEVMSVFGRVTTSRIDHVSTNQTVITHTHPFVGYAILLV